ncbi:flagellin [Phenylobacterium sp. J367]|uniref:flagellin n=1 Tax=Phenylobacterium sp. J367 TaxID=2898435 RepID=UPI0021514AB3|nr:flagellin [Phenylobacterium sp. J367]MCR5877086.1 flagellin [Phenylobacterium sp. J367]
MVTRVSTSGSYSAVLQNLLAAQARQAEASDQVATQKVGKDLKDYARKAEMLTAMRSVQTRLDVYAEQHMMIADKLTTQDTALNQITDAAGATRQAVLDSIAAGDAGTLMEELEAQLRNGLEGMNARYGGKYLFAGGQVDTKPVTATKLDDLVGPPLPAIASFFRNDNFQAQAKLDDSTVVTTGMLASDLGTQMLAAFQAIKAFHEGPSGPLDGKLTDAQQTFLESQLGPWETIRSDLTVLTGRNGLVQKRVDDVKDDVATRANTLAGMVGDITDADMTRAATELSAAQMSVQAAAQVFITLQNTSLLKLLQ